MNGYTESDIRKLWNMVFNISVNFLHDEQSAEDATQDIFIKAIEALPGFRGESALSTWVYRIAYNHLTDCKRHEFKDEISFDLFEQDVNHFTPYENELGLSEIEMDIYVEQIKIGCTKAMLQCLDPKDRFVYIIGKMFEFRSKDGAAICALTEDSYRQRLSRASRRLSNFMTANCGLLNEHATCRCRKRIRVALDRGRIHPDMLLHRTDSKKIKDYTASMNELDGVARIFRGNPYIEKAEFYTEALNRMVTALANG